MKDIKSALKKVKNEEKIAEKIAIFIKTKRGTAFVSKLHTASVKELCRNLQAPKFMSLYSNDTKNKNVILAVMKKHGITVPKARIIKLDVPKRVKYPIYLTKEEIGKIDAHRPKKKLGFAARMHAYEEYMMDKFKKKHPAPTEKELAEDLFPEELKAGYDNMLYIRREYVRNELCRRYAGTTPKEDFYRVFTVLSVTKDPATEKEHKPVISEVEPNSYVVGKPFVGYDKNTDINMLHNCLLRTAEAIHKADKNAIKVKLYNKYGDLVDSCECA